MLSTLIRSDEEVIRRIGEKQALKYLIYHRLSNPAAGAQPAMRPRGSSITAAAGRSLKRFNRWAPSGRRIARLSIQWLSKKRPICKRFFLLPLIPPFRISEFIFEKRYNRKQGRMDASNRSPHMPIIRREPFAVNGFHPVPHRRHRPGYPLRYPKPAAVS